MQRLFVLPLLLLVFSFTIISGIEGVIAAMKQGDASRLALFFDSSVEVNIAGQSNSYSKSQAEMVMKDFFKNNPVKSFDVIHQGENAGSIYCIGTLVTTSDSYRTTIFLKQKPNGQLIQELRLENK